MASTEREFLASYDPKQYDAPIITVDSVLFTIKDGQLCVLLVKRANHPYMGMWGIVGGFVDMKLDGTVEDSALRKLAEKTGVKPPYLNQLAFRGGAQRDPRYWSVSTTYYALIAHQACETHIADVTDVEWCPVAECRDRELAFDHQSIVDEALARLQDDATRTLIAAHVLPELFTLGQLQKVHEVILGCSLGKKSFRRRIEMANVLEETSLMSKPPGRPAKLYRVRPELDSYIFRYGLEID